MTDQSSRVKENSRASGGFPFRSFFFFFHGQSHKLFSANRSLYPHVEVSRLSFITGKKLHFDSLFFLSNFRRDQCPGSPPVNYFSFFVPFLFSFFFFPNFFVRQQIERKHSEAARVCLPPLQRNTTKSQNIYSLYTEHAHTLNTRYIHVSLSVCSTCIFYYTDCPRDSYSIPIVPTSLRNKISI